MEQEKKVVLDVTVANLGNFDTAERHSGAHEQVSGHEQVTMTRAAEELHIGKRQVQAGEVEITKSVETEHVREPVMLRGEEVDIERRPVTGRASGEVEISAQEIRIPVTEEEAVVEKRPVVKEEIVITKRPTQTQQTVEADVRTERVDVEQHGDINTRDRRDKTR
jgi:uncharacterized protein (TIGR02271 family)